MEKEQKGKRKGNKERKGEENIRKERKAEERERERESAALQLERRGHFPQTFYLANGQS